jgi:hypothetical protein
MDGVWRLQDEEGLRLYICAVVGKVDNAPCQAVLKVLLAWSVLAIHPAAAAATTST